MIDWKSVKDGKPATDAVCLVCCDKGFMGFVLALYHSGYDVFREYNSSQRDHLNIDVTHYIEIPAAPPLAERKNED